MQCPDDLNVSTDTDENTATVLWEVPVAIDNSGLLPVVDVTPAVVPPASLPIGTTYITYVAEDVSKNKAKCKFKVTVSGESLRALRALLLLYKLLVEKWLRNCFGEMKLNDNIYDIWR